MNIIFLNPSGHFGGAERSLLEILKSLREKEPQWQLYLVSGGHGLLVSRAKELGIKTIVVSFPSAIEHLGDWGQNRFALLGQAILSIPAIISYTKRLKNVLYELRPNLIHSNGFKMHLLGMWAKRSNTPMIWHIRDYVSDRPVMSRVLRYYAKHCAAIITNSKSVDQNIRKVFRTTSETYTVYNVVNPNSFSPEGDVLDLDSLSGLPQAQSGTIRVGLLGTFARWKGHEVFLESLSLIPQELTVRGYIIGGPVYLTQNSQSSLNELKNLAAKLGVENKVGFTGFVEDSAAAIRGLDIVVHASTRPEPFGLVIIEAMACGRPVVASKAGGPEEIIIEGENGLFHTPADAKELADRILRLVNNPELRKKLAINGRISVEHTFNAFRLADRIIPIYKNVLLLKN